MKVKVRVRLRVKAKAKAKATERAAGQEEEEPMARFLLHRPPPVPLPDSSGSFPLFTLSVAALLTVAFLPLPSVASADLFRLVYKGCSNQTVGGGSAALTALSSNLTSQADSSKFYQATASSVDSEPSFLGLFQCRGDLSASDCSACVARILPMWSSLCSSDSAAVRVQLTGCYTLYQVSGFPQVPGTELLYKECGSGSSGDDFEGRRDTAFAQLQSGVTGGGGFYATSYGSVYALAQCEGDLSASDCSDCVMQASQKSKAECGGAASGQVYLNKCYISYRYYANGVATNGDGGGESSVGGQTGKTVAIVVGATAGAGFLIICFLFARSVMKKKDNEW
ncbi:plasmodesmata-located protein 3-like isoform X1 [Zingiber officinale]|uniref:plasmodesmata-located protein 3-like isoform X1 n=1 Tax=Zingiber officinale TaxID=94328 RepID=UPI001C4C1C3D|nr:plasmodesmata-located protein 3-like isoform X1 [Zingiber officinale]